MTKKKSLIIHFIILQFFFCGLLLSTLSPTIASSSTCNNYDLKSSAVDFSNATVVSDGFNNSYWNDGISYNPAIAIDSSNKVHAVWQDGTNGVWGTDYEIMYNTYTTATGWSNATVISDGYGGRYWNDDESYIPAIAIDSSNAIHVVWEDDTDGVWGTDNEIMYINIEIHVPPPIIPDVIPFGNFYLLFIAVSILGLVAYKKRKL